MEKAFAQFQEWIAAAGLSLEQLGFLPGALDSEIDEIERITGLELPAALRYFLKQVNGQTENGMLLMPGGGCARLLSCDEIVKTWTLERQLATREGAMDFYDRYQDHDRVRGVLNAEGRLIVADEAGIAVVALDFIPGPNGVAGQVITDVSECEFVVVAPSFEAYFTKIVAQLTSRVLTIAYSDDFECHILCHVDNLDLVDADQFIQMP